MDDIDQYLNKMTLIAGDTNSGKTARTGRILDLFLSQGFAGEIAILDLAPDPIRGIGGKLQPPPDHPLCYLTTDIYAPRMMGTDENHTEQLARANAENIEQLFAEIEQRKKKILFVNDASLYLQAGDPDRFMTMLKAASTQIINTYYGKTFADSSLTRRERKRIEDLMKQCDRVIT
jgi:hypothetical protein